MIFYETVFVRKNPRMRMLERHPMVYASEVDARKAFNAEKRAMKKRNIDGENVSYFKITVDTDLNKEQWMKLFLSDHRGSHNCNDDDLLFVRDLMSECEMLNCYRTCDDPIKNKT